jgi:hypothetical protein
MRVARTLAIFLSLGLPGSAAFSQGQCNVPCMQQLQSRGVPPWEVQRMCCPAPFPAQHPPPGQVGQVCNSPVGRCMLPFPVAVGAPCYCATPYGPAGGQVGH